MKNINVKLALTLAGACLGWNAFAASTLIQHVRVFDGEKMFAPRDVLIDHGKILDANFKGKISTDMQLIEGLGRSLLPGLIDSHVHAYQHQELPLLFGVTTQIDMFSSVALMQGVSQRMQQGKNAQAPDMFSAGTLATAPSGHGTEYGMTIETLTKPEQAQAWVDARIAEGSYFIKIVMERGSAAHPFNSLDLATVKALITASHARHKLAVVHISTLQDARDALAAGADGLVHLFEGKAISKDEISQFVTLAKKQQAFVIPTFSVLESVAGVVAQDVLDDAAMIALLNKAQLQSLRTPYGKNVNEVLLVAPNALTRALQAAGVPVLAGTDAGNSGTIYGASLHHELSALVRAGLTPEQALSAATAAPAKAFQLRDRGHIAKGYKADFLLVEGDPSRDIFATRRIVDVWKDGERVTGLRAQQAQAVAAQLHEKRSGVQLPQDGRISLFSAVKLASPFGFGWIASNDAPMGGKSTVTWSLADKEPNGQDSILVKASVNAGFAYPWAGLAFFPAAEPMKAVDLRAANTLKFKVKGDGKAYNVGFTVEGSYIPISVGFVASPEWQEISLPFSQFKGLDAASITMLAFNAGPALGDYQWQLADVRLLKE